MPSTPSGRVSADVTPTRSDRAPRATSARSMAAAVAGGAALLAGGGCVERLITITSDPPGALVHVNDREIGRTPVETRFVHYGTFDVRLRKDGYEPLLTVGEAKPPVWDTVPLDFGAELLPIPLTARIAWHYELEPVRDDPAGLVERARELRDRLGPDPAAESPPIAVPDAGADDSSDG